MQGQVVVLQWQHLHGSQCCSSELLYGAKTKVLVAMLAAELLNIVWAKAIHFIFNIQPWNYSYPSCNFITRERAIGNTSVYVNKTAWRKTLQNKERLWVRGRFRKCHLPACEQYAVVVFTAALFHTDAQCNTIPNKTFLRYYISEQTPIICSAAV